MNIQTFKPLIAWLHLHPQWGGFITFLFAFGESTAIIGLIVPGSVIMSAIGVLVGAGILPLGSTVLWAIVGALLGDLLSYGFGYHYRNAIRSMWPFRLFNTWIDRGETFFQRHGGKSILIGRFLGPVRPLIPLIAGTLRMDFLRFLIVDTIAAIIWAPTYMFPGWIIGTASLALPPEAATRIITYLVVFLLLTWLSYWLLKKIILVLINFFDRIFESFWKILLTKKKFQPFCNLIKRIHIPDDHSQLTLLICFTVSLCLFLYLSYNVFIHGGLTHINIPTDAFFNSLYTPTLERSMLIITYIGKPSSLIIVWLVIFIWLCLRKLPVDCLEKSASQSQTGYRYMAIHWLLLGLTVISTTILIKYLVAYPRPISIKLVPTDYSFPSGHTTFSVAILGFLSVLIARDRKYYLRVITYSITCILVLLIAISRLVLGAHWATDIMGGLLLGLSILFIYALAYRRHHIIMPHAIELIVITCLSLSGLWLVNMTLHFNKDIENFKPSWPIIYLDQNHWWQQGVNNAPLYRNNLIGKKVQTMNIEFYGNIDELKQNLIQQGWVAKSSSKIIQTLHYLGTKDHRQTLPLFKKVYHSQAPRLELGKQVANTKQYLILQLWDSHIILLPDNNTLWVGTLNFSRAANFFFITKLTKDKKTVEEEKPKPLDIFLNCIKNYHYRLRNYNIPKLNELEDIDWDKRVLLIKK